MPLDDSTWVIHSLPNARTEEPAPTPEQPVHAFRSVLSPWRGDERPANGRGGPARAAS